MEKPDYILYAELDYVTTTTQQIWKLKMFFHQNKILFSNRHLT